MADIPTAASGFASLPLGRIRPTGWLARQLRIQADGLGGHLDEFWPDVKDSGWIGGNAEGWERAPYWLDGFLPLAFLLDDETLLAKVHRWMNHLLDSQRDDGWVGPELETDDEKAAVRHDTWPYFIFMKIAIQYHSATGDGRVIPCLEKLTRRLREFMRGHPLNQWASFRWMDLGLCLIWLAGKLGEDWPRRLAHRASLMGYEWSEHFADLPFKDKCVGVPDRYEGWTYDNHIVNHAMGLKTAAVRNLIGLSRSSEAADALAAIAEMDRHHGQAAGVFSGDESLAGRHPSQGTELCAVVETMFSLECLATVFGPAAGSGFGDRLEKITFNALPATFSPDMWTHQYLQQANQIFAGNVGEDRIYTNNSGNANAFGLEPHFGCCLANMHQGWPKFASHLWMQSDRALANIAWAPCEVRTTFNNTPVVLRVETDYPFRQTIRLHVAADRATEFDLMLRIPTWACGATVTIDGEDPRPAVAGEYHTLSRTWDQAEITIDLPAEPTVERRYNQAATLQRGPLVYSLKIEDDWQQRQPLFDWHLRDHERAVEYDVSATSLWNVALKLDDADPTASLTFTEAPLGDCPFSPDGAPISATVTGRLLEGWAVEHGAAAAPPQSPVASEQPEQTFTLIPYGCSNLRITEFPTLA